MVAALILRGQHARPSRFFAWMSAIYGRMLNFTLRHRAIFVVVIVAMFIGSLQLLKGIEKAYSTRTLEREIIIKVDIPKNYAMEQTAALYEEVYARMDPGYREMMTRLRGTLDPNGILNPDRWKAP